MIRTDWNKLVIQLSGLDPVFSERAYTDPVSDFDAGLALAGLYECREPSCQLFPVPQYHATATTRKFLFITCRACHREDCVVWVQYLAADTLNPFQLPLLTKP